MVDILDAKIKGTAELGKTSFGHNGEVYTDLRPHTTSAGLEGYRFDLGDKNDPYLKVYFISDDGTYLSVWERGYGTRQLRFNTSFDEDTEQTLNDRFNSLNAQLDEAVFHARLATAVQTYEDTGQSQDFECRGNSYTNLHDPGKSHVGYRFQYGHGDQLKVFFFAEDGSYVSGWSRAGQTTHAHPDKTETENLYDRLVEVDEQLPSSFTVPFALEEHLDILGEDPDGEYEFQIAGRDMTAVLAPGLVGDYLIFPDSEFVNNFYSSFAMVLSTDGTSFTFFHPNFGLLDFGHDWGWSPTNNDELGSILYGTGVKDSLYTRVSLFEHQLSGIQELYNDGVITDDFYLSGFSLVIEQVPNSNEIRFNLHGVLSELSAYGEYLTDIYVVFTRDLAGPEIRSISFEGEYYNLLGYGEEVSLEGNVYQDRIQLNYEASDLLGYDETFNLDLVINELPDGYIIDFDLSSEDLFIPVECSATIQVNQDFTVSSSEINCSDMELEEDLEDIFDELAEAASQLVAVSDGLQDVFIVDETAPEYAGAFAPVDNDVWIG